MTNGELIQACAGQCCARCDYHSECETFKRIYDRLPEELGFMAKKEGATAEVTLNLSIPIDEDWLNTEMSITLIKALVHSEINKLADEENRITGSFSVQKTQDGRRIMTWHGDSNESEVNKNEKQGTD